MSLEWNLGAEIRLQSPWTRRRIHFPPKFHNLRRRPRRLKPFIRHHHQLSCSFSSSSLSSSQPPPPFDDLFHTLISQLNSFALLAPALGFATALALYNYHNTNANTNTNTNKPQFPPGDWALFTSPTPFNRFVTLRCPSLLLFHHPNHEDELFMEDGHILTLNQGPIQPTTTSTTSATDHHSSSLGKELSYQRICVNTPDGGVISLDWPAHLELNDEHALDTTVLIVPGTADGSMDDNIRLFVSDCLKHGCFPIVMNPRGCARSPLTTPRLFTAADSDDVCTAAQFINTARPWTTLMGVGWGYGANMLTKYLAEVGENTPLTAATCIDNPFDLKGAAGSSPYLYVDQNLTVGLIDILQSNKELFQGRPKGFDVEKALQATSVRDFEEAISMVSYGFDSIEDFYSNSGTRDVVGNVKIPLLFIQNNCDAVPLLSIPRSSIAENPFTSLLICSSPSYDKSTTRATAVSWCQHLVIEWLTSVELGLLKGRHPLLEDTDVTINPSKRLRLMENRVSHTSGRISNPVNLWQLEASDGQAFNPLEEVLKRNDAYPYSISGHGSQNHSESEDRASKQDTDGVVKQSNLVDTGVVKETEVDSVDGERGKVIQTAKVVMNMLDVAMPETLSEEHKKKVLTAVGQGETLMNALQDAVPEDVRGKISSSVAAILQNQKSNLNGLSADSRTPNMPSGVDTKMQELVRLSSEDVDPHTSDQNKGDNHLAEGYNNQPSKIDACGGSVEPEAHTAGNLGKSADSSQSSNHGGDASDSVKTSHEDFGSNNESAEFPKEKASLSSQHHVSEISANPEVSSQPESAGSADDQISEQVKVGQEGETAFPDTKEDSDSQQKEETDEQSSLDEKKISSPRTEETLTSSASSLENQFLEKESSENQIKEESSAQPVANQSSSNPPTFSVSQAFDALSGIDDSTQAAVNSVFSVIEGVINQLEVNKSNGSSTSDENKAEEKATDSESKKHLPDIDLDLQLKEERKKNADSHGSCNLRQSLSISKLSAEKKDENRVTDNSMNDVAYCITKLTYGDPLYNQYLQDYLNSKLKDEKSPDLDAATALFLDYIPEEGQWKLLEQSRDGKWSVDESVTHEGMLRRVERSLQFDTENTNSIIEPAYVILDSENEWDPLREHEKKDEIEGKLQIGDPKSGVLMQLVKRNLLGSLKVEIRRRVGLTDMEEIAPIVAKELEHIANAISLAAVNGKVDILSWNDEGSVRAGTLHTEHILEAISSAVLGTRYVKKVIPVGIIVGSSLASLRKFFNIAAADARGNSKVVRDQTGNTKKGYDLQSDRMVADSMPFNAGDGDNNLYSASEGYEEEDGSGSLKGDAVMVGAVTAALGASALLVHQQDSHNDGLESSGISSTSAEEKENQHRRKLDEEMSERSNHNIVTSLAEKAMSVAAPIVPTKEDGEVDQDRLVSMLADLGQKGGILKLVGKVALLWSGIRGAMSLIDKLISFLRFAERPLFQRILGFVCMVLVLWTPVVVPLLPALVQNWAAHNSSKIAELTCIFGLYISIMILVVLWGKRIRSYGDPLERYGLELTSARQIQNFLSGLIGGVMLVLLIHSLNVLLGIVSLSWPTTPSSTDALTLFKLYSKVLTCVGQGLVTAIGVALVEELLFRSWLPDEIAADLGYNQGVILSGLAFSLSQRSLAAIPGLWLFSLGLAGARQRSGGSLSVPIGLRAGIMASSYVLKVGGFLTYQPNFPSWVSGSNPFQPFSGIVGLAVALVLAVILYPREFHRMHKRSN